MTTTYGVDPVWGLGRPHIKPLRLLVSWVLSTLALVVACWIVPGAAVNGFWAALAAAALIAVLNAILPPIIAALRLPWMLVVGLLLILIVDALMLLATLPSTRSGRRSASRSWRQRSPWCSTCSSARTTMTPTPCA
jgi:uncharacterized membrane protein YvlD (DUF360 family)